MFLPNLNVYEPSNGLEDSVKQPSGASRTKMKYHTLSTSSLASRGKKSTLTIYADMGFKHDKLQNDLLAARRELEGVQNALHHQTQRCRELVKEFSRKLQSKTQQIYSERQLRDQQLTKVLRALLLFEARLVKEQQVIHQQLREKDTTIHHQQSQILKLQAAGQYCKNCHSTIFESEDSSLDINIFAKGHLPHNFDDSCSEIYGPVLEKNNRGQVFNNGSGKKIGYDGVNRVTYIKNKQNYFKNNDSKRLKKYSTERRKGESFFDMTNHRGQDSSSNDEGSTSKSEPVDENISKVSQRIENIFDENHETIAKSRLFSERMDSLHGIKQNCGNENEPTYSDELYTSSSLSGGSSSTSTNYCSTGDIRGFYEPNGNFNCYSSTKSESTTTYGESLRNTKNGDFSKDDSVSNEIFNDDSYESEKNVHSDLKYDDSKNDFMFGKNDSEANDNWYASASDHEDDQQCDVYRNNPVLECMNQILLQNINDTLNSPPKSPVDPILKSKSPKRVKFIDESDGVSVCSSQDIKKIQDINEPSDEDNYYETPIQGISNVYEVPQSIYSNDYEQILINQHDCVHNWATPKNSLKSEKLKEKEFSRVGSQKLSIANSTDLDNLDEMNNYYYVDMDVNPTDSKQMQTKKCKLSRTPPALPPKPANLVSKYKINGNILSTENVAHISRSINTPEPDYCSISELNMAVIESKDDQNSAVIQEPLSSVAKITSIYDQIINTNSKKAHISSNYKSTPKKHKRLPKETKTPKITSPEIPMLPQVSEIIIPSESETESKDENISVTQDNYIKNNSQLFKQKFPKPNESDKYKRPIQIGTSVSSLITGFNNQHILSEINNRRKSPSKHKKHPFSNFDSNQNFDKHYSRSEPSEMDPPLNFEKFDLSQNFEEFNLDDCEICEEYHIDISAEKRPESPTQLAPDKSIAENSQKNTTEASQQAQTRDTEMRAAAKEVAIAELRDVLSIPPNSPAKMKPVKSPVKALETVPATPYNQQPNYEQFLECTGLSSKSILTPSRLLSNHKSMLKPKDVKLRDRVRSTATFERHGNTVKYYSEPYL